MSNYVRNFTESFDFDGDKVTVTMKQLRRTDALTIMPHAASMGSIKKGEAITAEQVEGGGQFIELTSQALKEGKYISALSGLTIDGRQVDINNAEDMEIIYEDFYFTALIATLGGLLIMHSAISKEIEKKLEEQPITEQQTLSEKEMAHL